MLPQENFRNFGLPSTTFHTFSWRRKRKREARVVKRKSKSKSKKKSVRIYETIDSKSAMK